MPKYSNSCHTISTVFVKDVHILGLCSVVIISLQDEASPRYALLDFGYPFSEADLGGGCGGLL